MGRWPSQSQWDFCWASRKDSLTAEHCGWQDVVLLHASYFSKGEPTWECGQTEKESSDGERTKGPRCCWVSTWNCTRGLSVTSAVTVSDIYPHTASSSWAHKKATFLSLPCRVYETKLQAKEICAEMIEATFKPFPKNILLVCLILPRLIPPTPNPSIALLEMSQKVQNRVLWYKNLGGGWSWRQYQGRPLGEWHWNRGLICKSKQVIRLLGRREGERTFLVDWKKNKTQKTVQRKGWAYWRDRKAASVTGAYRQQENERVLWFRRGQ